MDLSEENKKLCEQLRERITDLKVTDEAFYLTDFNLIRFIKARGKNVDKAEDMFRKSIAWREDNDIDNARQWEVAEDLKEGFRYGISGLSREGGVVICVNIAEWNPYIAHGRYEEILKVAYQEIETIIWIIRYYAMKNNRFSKMLFIINLEGLAWAHVSTIEWIKALTTVLKALEANYPDTLKAAFLLNAPWVFTTLWTVIKPFISPATHNRLKFLGADRKIWRTKILELVDEDQFPEKFGGTSPNDTKLLFEDGTVIRTKQKTATDLTDAEKLTNKRKK